MVQADLQAGGQIQQSTERITNVFSRGKASHVAHHWQNSVHSQDHQIPIILEQTQSLIKKIVLSFKEGEAEGALCCKRRLNPPLHHIIPCLAEQHSPGHPWARGPQGSMVPKDEEQAPAMFYLQMLVLQTSPTNLGIQPLFSNPLLPDN